jgi:Uncharacterised MFS-type transporter YbfB
LLLCRGLAETWLGLGIVSLLLTLIAWRGWPSEPRPAVTPHNPRRRHAIRGLRALYAEYGLNAVGLVPHMIFLVDFVARGLGQGMQAGAAYWVLFGLGALAGPIVSGHIADRTGFGPALRVAFVIEAVAVALPRARPEPNVARPFERGRRRLRAGHRRAGARSGARAARPPSGRAPDSVGRGDHQLRDPAGVAAYGMSYLFLSNGGGYRMLFARG